MPFADARDLADDMMTMPPRYVALAAIAHWKPPEAETEMTDDDLGALRAALGG